MQPKIISLLASTGASVTPEQVREAVAQACPAKDYKNKRILMIVPDATRTAPVGMLFKALHQQIGTACQACDVMIALGTHPPMSEEAMCARLEITPEERRRQYGRVQLLNHEWDNPGALKTIGTISSDEISILTGGLFSMEVEVKINRRVFDYDQLIIIGPVFPHEVVGFSGGNKYLFPGVSGPEVLNFFHWLGAVVTNPMIIGNKWTPVRKVIDHASSMVDVDKLCFSMVVKGTEMAGLFVSTPESAWDEASELSRKLHIIHKEKPFHTVLSCAPPMYEELWVGGKCMYKLEPIVADGGELIIYAPHIHEVSVVHGKLIEEIGYHCRDYFLSQWDIFKDKPWGVLAHSTHVRGIGKMVNGVEKCRIRVTLATGIRPEVCAKINLGYRDPATIDVDSFANREDEGVLLVRKAGEKLYHLREQPEWAGGKPAAMH
jgi:lactate racemase